MRALLAAFFGLVFALPASAQQAVDSTQVEKTYLTIYPNDLAMITEVRRFNVPAGLSTIRFLGVSDQIIAQTAILQSFEGISLESNFDGDLISKGSLLNKAVGETLTIRRINAGNGEVTNVSAKLVSASRLNDRVQGAVFETSDGVEALECSGLFESLVFNSMPDALNPTPVLSMDVRADVAGETEISLSYLSRGIGWAADYRLDVGAEQMGEGNLAGWLTLTNSTAKSFKDAGLAVVAGELNRVSQNRFAAPNFNVSFSPTCWKTGYDFSSTTNQSRSVVQSGGAFGYSNKVSFAAEPMLMMESEGDEIVVTGARREAKQEDLGDYKLYRAPQDVTVAAHQTKQIAFLSIPDAEFEKVFKYDFSEFINRFSTDGQPFRTRVEYELDNSKEGNLAQPLPRGTMRVMTVTKDGRTAFLGEDSLRDLAIDLPVEVKISESAAVTIFPRIEEGEAKNRRKFKADVFNATAQEITVEITIQSENIRYDMIRNESHDRKEGEIIPTYKFTVPAESKETFSIDVKGKR